MLIPLESYVLIVSLAVIFITPYFFQFKSPSKDEKKYKFKFLYLLATGLTLGLKVSEVGSYRRYKAIVGSAMYTTIFSIIALIAD